MGAIEEAPATIVAAVPSPAKKTKVPKAKKPSAPKKPAAHPPYFEMICEAVSTLKERTGSSQYAISKFIEDKHKANLAPNFKKLLLVQLKKATAAGKLTKVKNSYKISAAAIKPVTVKKAAVAKPKTKPAAVKPKKAVAKPKAKPAAAKPKPKAAAAKPKAKAKPTAAKPKAKPVAPKPKTVAKKPAGRPVKKAAAPAKKAAAAKVKKAPVAKKAKK